MKKTFLAACAFLCAGLFPLPIQADPYVWDNQNNNGIWNDPVNWGILNNPNTNVAPTAADSAIFRSSSPAGTVTLTNDGFAQKIRQNVSAPARIITIDADETVDRILTLSGTADELIECTAATASFTLDGTPNGNGARLRLRIDGSGVTTGTRVNGGVTLAVNCDVSGAGGFILNGGSSGAGKLILGGANTYTGPTTVNAGTLLVNGSTAAASPVTVNSGGTLGGTGTVGGSVALTAGSTLAPGASVGTLTVNGNLTLAGNLAIEVDKSLSPSNDMVTVTGTLSNTGSGNLTVTTLGQAELAAGTSSASSTSRCSTGRRCTLLRPGGRSGPTSWRWMVRSPCCLPPIRRRRRQHLPPPA